MKKRQRTTTTSEAEPGHYAMKSGGTISDERNSIALTSIPLARRSKVSLLHVLVLLSLLLSSFGPAAEARLVGNRRRRQTEQAYQDQQYIDNALHPREVSDEFAVKYPTIAAEIIRRRQRQKAEQQRLHVEQDGENEAGYHLDTQDGVAIVRDLQQQLTVTSVNDRTNNKPLITLTISKQPSSSSSSSAVDTMLQNQVSNLKATKAQNQRGAQTLDVEFVLDRTDAARQQTSKTRFQVQINLVALAMGRTNGLSITAQEEGGEEVNGKVTGVDKLIVSEHPGDGDGGHPEHNGLHLMAVAPPNKQPAPLTTIVDETILPP